jgi:hypothetical protein
MLPLPAHPALLHWLITLPTQGTPQLAGRDVGTVQQRLAAPSLTGCTESSRGLAVLFLTHKSTHAFAGGLSGLQLTNRPLPLSAGVWCPVQQRHYVELQVVSRHPARPWLWGIKRLELAAEQPDLVKAWVNSTRQRLKALSYR